MEAKVLAWAWANTLGNLVGGSRKIERWLWAFGHSGSGHLGWGDRGTYLSEMSLKMIMLTEICVKTATITCCNLVACKEHMNCLLCDRVFVCVVWVTSWS